MRPPFQITSKIMSLVADISRLVGGLEATTLTIPNPKLRKKNKIRTVKSTLAIEGNTFTEEQISAILEGKRVLGSEKELQEVHNAIELYESIDDFNSNKAEDFLKAHKTLMKGLVATAGKWRTRNVGVLAGTKVKHLAPKPMLVPELMEKLFKWLSSEKELHPLILSSIVHYEIEFIHPFEDGNGRMGRFWQALILTENDNFFRYVPVESLIEKNQQAYYQALEDSDKAGDSTIFIEFILGIIKLTLEEMSKEIVGVTNTYADRIQRAKDIFGDKFFSRKEYMEEFKTISSATASRDLKDAVDEDVVEKVGERNQTKYRFVV
ncbi:Fic/DOC family protein [Bacteriovorax sp. BAL6_X]|uniref:Fic family protein n=1 Tax=Bacteriovorax sp. BAL6_X TaxID=1201290 RepID=UPI000385C728|nr:Fic family protein [Bacteriovorax sp. BAL6_X]EPZ50166.1 Fic/DOC family protein [Bacteriovorax sp. BAL6_X]